MILAGFCRNCLADWIRDAGFERYRGIGVAPLLCSGQGASGPAQMRQMRRDRVVNIDCRATGGGRFAHFNQNLNVLSQLL